MDELRFLFVVCCLVACGFNRAFAERMMNFEFRADYLGKYIWRGQNIDDDPVLQPSITASYNNLTATIWGNLELTNINGHSGDFTEVDYSFEYSGDIPGIEGVRYAIGTIYYDFPGTNVNDTTELYWGLKADLPLCPSLTLYHDLDEADGTYLSVELGHSIEKIASLLPDIPITMEIGASLGWGTGSYNKYYWGTNQSELNDLAFSVSFPVEVVDWTVAPSLHYVTLVSGDIRSADAYGTDSDFFFAGVSLSRRF